MDSPKLLLIVDHRHVTRWQIKALEGAAPGQPLTVLSCTNTRIRRRLGKHFLYYVLRSLCFSKSWSGKVPLAESGLDIGEVVEFESEYDGAWQRFPEAVLARIQAERPDAIVKFGMSLLRIPPELGAPILGYHHGDPDHYRGRPAGFYELLHKRDRMGQIVQRLSNKLDAGTVLAFAETRLVPHSYRATLSQAYGHSPFLLAQALRNLEAGRTLPKPSTGRNYRLPANGTVIRFAAQRMAALVRLLLYGALFEKKWTVSTAPLGSEPVLEQGALPPRSGWQDLPRARPYTFYADPFFSREPEGVMVEAMNGRSGKGELLLVAGDGASRRLTPPGRHFSYPATVAEDGRNFVVPEIASWSEPRIYTIGEQGLEEAGRLWIEGGARVVDPTFHRHDGRLYLFGNRRDVGCGALFLWSSDSLFGAFVEHPLNPILISPYGSRMAGQLVRHGEALYRLGQNGLRAYGDGALAFRVETLTPSAYAERFEREIRFDAVRGPHTVNWSDGEMLFDWYRDRFAPLAWLRRLQGRLGNKTSS